MTYVCSCVLQNAFQVEFSCPIGDPERCEDSSNMESAHHFSSKSGVQKNRGGCLFHTAHRKLCKTICFGTVRCWSTMIPGELFTSFAEFQGLVSINDFWHGCRLEKLRKGLLRFLSSLCFARIRLRPLSGQVLYSDGILVTVSRFTLFIENFVICRNQVTNMFFSRYLDAGAFSERSSCNFGSAADFAVSVFREVSVHIVIPGFHW